MISSNILYLLLTIHKKFLLLSNWTLVYFTHHLFYNEYIYIFFFFPSSFFRISQRFRLIDGKMIYCCGEHPRADNASPLYERCTHIMLRCRDPKWLRRVPFEGYDWFNPTCRDRDTNLNSLHLVQFLFLPRKSSFRC